MRKKEINRILKLLSNQIRPYLNLLIQYQDFLSDIDVIAAKAKYANRINGILPTITEERRLYFREVPSYFVFEQQTKNEITHPQTIELDQENRIIVISGPNAGGKQFHLKRLVYYN
jgi:DNA mismatch repair protein MutS2